MAGWGAPLAGIYGFIRGLQSLPHLLIPEMLGACLGRYWLQRRLGPEEWQRRAPILLAGFACGQGLVGMAAVGVVLIVRAVAQLPY